MEIFSNASRKRATSSMLLVIVLTDEFDCDHGSVRECQTRVIGSIRGDVSVDNRAERPAGVLHAYIVGSAHLHLGVRHPDTPYY